MPPWSGRQMTSFLSQCKPRNTHLGAAVASIYWIAEMVHSRKLDAFMVATEARKE
jgi:hypothetical protein